MTLPGVAATFFPSSKAVVIAHLYPELAFTLFDIAQQVVKAFHQILPVASDRLSEDFGVSERKVCW